MQRTILLSPPVLKLCSLIVRFHFLLPAYTLPAQSEDILVLRFLSRRDMCLGILPRSWLSYSACDLPVDMVLCEYHGSVAIGSFPFDVYNPVIFTRMY